MESDDLVARTIRVEEAVERRRIDSGQCPTHGLDLVPAPVETAGKPPGRRCPDKFCAYRIS